MSGIPTIRFDVSAVTDTVKADLKTNIKLLEEIDKVHFEKLYEAALRSILAGGELSVLYRALMQMNISGMTKRRAEQIALLLNNKATSIMNKERQELLGIKQALWAYSGAPCEKNPTKPTGQDVAHKAANEKLYDVSKGMFLNGKWTWPGFEEGCRCWSKSVIPCVQQ